MLKVIEKLYKQFPCRDGIFQSLYELVGSHDEQFPQAVFLYGHTGTGKTVILKEFLKCTKSKYGIIDCIGHYTTKLLLEGIINKLRNHNISLTNGFAPYCKCENMETFIQELQKLDDRDSYIICIENCERLRDMDFNILPSLTRLQELTGLNICVVLVSQIPFEKFYLKTGLPDVITIYCPQYTKSEIQAILLCDFQYLKNRMKSISEQSDNVPEHIKSLDFLQVDFYENFLSFFLNVFYRVCRDLQELRMISRECFEIYCKPVLDGSINSTDVTKLWRNISKPLRFALAKVYMRINQHSNTAQNYDEEESVRKLSQTLELPYYAKYFLIAGFLASYNAAKGDKRLFMKNHGKQKKRVQAVNANAKTIEKMSTKLGPKSFTIDRMLAIFYAIIDEKVGLTCNLLSQISTLVRLKFFTFTSGEANIMEGSARLQCTVSLDFILHIGKTVGFNVSKYLSDFM